MRHIKRGLAYKGEINILLFQNLHRYFLYFALIFLVILFIDVVHALIWPTASSGFTVGVSLGTLVFGCQRCVAGSIYLFVSFPTPFGRRQSGQFLQGQVRSAALQTVDVGVTAKPRSYVVGMAEPVYGRIRRPLCVDGRVRRDQGHSILLMKVILSSDEQVRNPRI